MRREPSIIVARWRENELPDQASIERIESPNYRLAHSYNVFFNIDSKQFYDELSQLYAKKGGVGTFLDPVKVDVTADDLLAMAKRITMTTKTKTYVLQQMAHLTSRHWVQPNSWGPCKYYATCTYPGAM